MPKWISKEQRKEIELIYEHARECTVLTGDRYVVDHIVPLKGVNVCGLHVPWNLQVLPSDVNDSKGNRLIEELAIANG
jgi:5-methylcytosine-specific restriction endonuclease McrA